MAINPLIALGVRVPDTATPIRNFSAANRQRKQDEQQASNDAFTRQRAVTSDARLDRQEQRLISKEQRDQLLATQGDAVERNLRVQSRLHTLNQHGDTKGARAVLQRFIEEGEKVPGRDLSHSRAQLALDDSAFKADVAGEVETGIRFGDITQLRETKSDVLSPDAEAQKIRIGTAKARAGKPTSTTNIINAAQAKGLTEEQKKLAEVRVNRFAEIQTRALDAEEQNAQLDQLGNINLETGFGVQGRAVFASVVNGLGGDGAAIAGVDPANVEAFNAITVKQVLSVMASQKGPQTKQDQEKIADTLQQVGNQPKANRFISASLKALNLRRIEMNDFYTRFLEGNEGSLVGADSAWSQFKQSMPMLSDQVPNVETGLPMFFHEFKIKFQELNPGQTDEQTAEKWRELTK